MRERPGYLPIDTAGYEWSPEELAARERAHKVADASDALGRHKLRVTFPQWGQVLAPLYAMDESKREFLTLRILAERVDDEERKRAAIKRANKALVDHARHRHELIAGLLSLIESSESEINAGDVKEELDDLLGQADAIIARHCAQIEPRAES